MQATNSRAITRRALIAAATVSALAIAVASMNGEPASAQTSMGPVDMAPSADLNRITRTFDVIAGDWNADGYDDLLVVPHDPDSLREGETATSLPIFYESDGDGSFSEKSTSLRGRDRHGCAFGDLNVDGRLDFFCTVGYNGRTNKELGLQTADGSFVDAAPYTGLWERGNGRHRTVALFDANGDMYPDIYMTRYYGKNNWDGSFSPAEDPPKANEFWINHGGTRFVHAPDFGLDQPIGAPKDASSCAQGVDYNDDGHQDLLVCGFQSLTLYQNEDGESFTDVTTEMGVGGLAIDAGLVDLDNDGHLDLARVRGRDFRLRLWNGTRWAPPSTRLKLDGGGQDLAFGDFDGDGLEDIFLVRNCVKQQDKSDYLFINQGGGRFQRTDLPALPRGGGCGNAVAAMDYDDDGLTDFVVVNGHKKKAGPIQLWSYKPRG